MRIYFDPVLYPRPAVDQAVGAFTPLASVSRDIDRDAVVIEPNADPSLVDEFLNFVLMAALELHLKEL